MLKGKNVWNEWYQKGMGEMRIGERTVYSFPDMKKSFYDMLRASAEKYPHKTGLCDNWNRSYTYREVLSMTDSLAFYLRETMQVKKGGHVGLLLNNGIEFAASFYAIPPQHRYPGTPAEMRRSSAPSALRRWNR